MPLRKRGKQLNALLHLPQLLSPFALLVLPGQTTKAVPLRTNVSVCVSMQIKT